MDKEEKMCSESHTDSVKNRSSFTITELEGKQGVNITGKYSDAECNFDKENKNQNKKELSESNEWQFPPMTVNQLANLLDNVEVRKALQQLNPTFESIFSNENAKSCTNSRYMPNDQFQSAEKLSYNISNQKRIYTSNSELRNENVNDMSKDQMDGCKKLCVIGSKEIDIMHNSSNTNNANLIPKYGEFKIGTQYGLINSELTPSAKKYSLKAFGEYDMIELKVMCDSFANKDIGVCRILAIHSGITLYNLHRCIAISLKIDRRASEEYLHAWIVNDGTVYGGGKSCSPAMSRRLSLQTDRHTTYRQLVQLPVDESGLVHKHCCPPLTYIFGKIQCQIYLNDFLLQRTNSADLLWVPRCCYGSYGTTPYASNWKNFKALEFFKPESEVDLDSVNLDLMQTRFSRNVASCRRTQRKRMKGIDQFVLKSYRTRIQEFFTDRIAIQRMANYVTTKANKYAKSAKSNKLSLKSWTDYKSCI